MIILIKLLLAHLLGDFVLQPSKWAKAKEELKIKAYQLYLHIGIHFILILLLIWDWEFWPWALIIASSHLIIDSLKIYLQKPGNARTLFFADQLLHLLVIVVIWFLYHQNFQLWLQSFDENNLTKLLLWISAFVFLTKPLSVAIRIFISKWTPHTENNKNDSLQSAGEYIGYLERILIFIFIIINQLEAVGFLLAAKSIFRFGDLTASKDRKLTEYVLIGTLLSFGAAICTSLLFGYLLTLL
ncbi:DUF3307 domain-containing protein [Albibacterium profundi]|uniref:DUF3307 domain-containing protein n=1 Tax=Albibacterium profundi TaxID=3134906 RepID=A0ABV5C9W5_9SPHI